MGIKIKGKADGVLDIEIQPLSSYVDIKESVADKLSKNKEFFMGAGIKIVFSGKTLSDAQKKDLKTLLHMDYDIINVAFRDKTTEKKSVDIKRPKNDGNTVPPEKSVNLISKDYFDAKSVFVSHTLRSGQRIECEGDVVVLGDINDGAEVIAGGSIAVMGTLRGLVHAGATGRDDVVVAANDMRPKQLRISGKIAIFEEDHSGGVPEVAEYKKGSIVIKPIKPLGRNAR